jgi:protein KRI1
MCMYVYSVCGLPLATAVVAVYVNITHAFSSPFFLCMPSLPPLCLYLSIYTRYICSATLSLSIYICLSLSLILHAERALLERAAAADGDDDSPSESEDEDGDRSNPKIDSRILDVVKAIRNRDQSIYDPQRKFFDDVEASGDSDDDDDDGDDETSAKKSSKKTKKLSVREMMTSQLLNGGDSDSDSDSDTGGIVSSGRGMNRDKLKRVGAEPSIVEKQKLARREFIRNADASDSDSEDDTTLFAAKAESSLLKQVEKEQQEAEQKASGSKSGTAAATAAAPIDDDAFLQSFVTQEWWRGKNTEALPSYSELHDGASEPEDVDVSGDEGYLDQMDEFEHAYNFRFEEEDGATIQTYPRTIQDSVRQSSSKRARQRESRKKRKEELMKKRTEEIKQIKNRKKRAIMEKLHQIAAITGNDQVGFDEVDLTKEFDPQEYDAKTSEIFNEDFYKDDGDGDGDGDGDDNHGNGTTGGGGSTDGKSKEQDNGDEVDAGFDAGDRKGNMKPNRFWLETQKKLKQAGKEHLIKDKLEELYNLDFEDVIAGDIACRFKYTQVAPCDYGMTAADILFGDEKQLNSRVSLKKLAPYRDDAGDNTPWQKQRGRKRKPSGHAGQVEKLRQNQFRRRNGQEPSRTSGAAKKRKKNQNQGQRQQQQQQQQQQQKQKQKPQQQQNDSNSAEQQPQKKKRKRTRKRKKKKGTDANTFYNN